MAAMAWDGVFADIDPLTMRAMVQLQLEDSEEVAARAKGKQREDEKTDARIAMEMYVEDLKSCDATLQDRNMAQSLAMAILQDGDLIAQAYKQEQQLAQDRELASRLANGEPVGASTRWEAQQSRPKKWQYKDQKNPWEDQEMLDKVAAIYMHQPKKPMVPETVDNDDSDGTVAESSAWAASRNGSRKRPLRNCVVCGEEKDFFEVARVPCDHEYCRPCLKELFTLSMKDESLFPPRCDNQEIPLDLVRFFLPSDVAKEFESKYDELSTHNRTYCHEASCVMFIPSELHTGDIATCPKCRKTTCVTCKGPSHSGDCPNDEALHQLIELANTAQWQRCYRCTRFVELNLGCNHMSCKCGAQFCYVCGVPWKQCACEQWDERRLLDRAAQIVDRDPRRRLFQPAHVAHAQPATLPATASTTAAAATTRPASSQEIEPVQAAAPSSASPSGIFDHEERAARNARSNRIAAAMEHLRHNHGCDHDKWRWVRGPHQCEECNDVLREYIFECRQCHLQACNRCRRNRL